MECKHRGMLVLLGVIVGSDYYICFILHKPPRNGCISPRLHSLSRHWLEGVWFVVCCIVRLFTVCCF